MGHDKGLRYHIVSIQVITRVSIKTTRVTARDCKGYPMGHSKGDCQVYYRDDAHLEKRRQSC